MEKLPLAYVTEIESLGLTQLLGSYTSVEEAQDEATARAIHDGVILVCIKNIENELLFVLAR